MKSIQVHAGGLTANGERAKTNMAWPWCSTKEEL